jgi:hypothetical protein
MGRIAFLNESVVTATQSLAHSWLGNYWLSIVPGYGFGAWVEGVIAHGMMSDE